MSCDVVASLAFLWLAAAGPQAAPMQPEHVAPPSATALEPLFADIVRRAGSLKSAAEALQSAQAAADPEFRRQVGELSELDMKAHLVLAQRGGDGDLKCILRGISQDLPVKLSALDAAKTGPERADALSELIYLLNDNVEVITAPAKPPV